MKILYDNPRKERPDTISCDRLYISPERIALFEDNACIKSISLNDVIMITDNQIESPLENNWKNQIKKNWGQKKIKFCPQKNFTKIPGTEKFILDPPPKIKIEVPRKFFYPRVYPTDTKYYPSYRYGIFRKIFF